jgi:branched-chain amino acid transport system substrate-binding protein
MTGLCIGVVVPRTGRLAPLGEPLSFVVDRLAPRLTRLRGHDLRLAVRDSRSEPATARDAARALVEEERAGVVVTMAGTQVLPAVADACEALGVPCVSTTFPWQAYGYARGGDPLRAFRWTYHFAWGLDDIAGVFADLWERLPGDGGAAHTVGCLWNDDLQGTLLRHEEFGFAPAARARGHRLVDPGAYREPATDLSGHVTRLCEAGADIVTSAATATDLALFHRQAREAGARPRLITCSRWLTYPHTATARDRQVHDELADARIATLVYWSPGHPHRSGLDGTTCAELADAYQESTGRPWLQPLGLAHALLETAHHALATAPDPTDRAAVADTLAKTRLDTVAGTVDFTAGPTPSTAVLPLAGGQWHPGPHGPRLAIVTNTRTPDVPVTADLVPAG